MIFPNEKPHMKLSMKTQGKASILNNKRGCLKMIFEKAFFVFAKKSGKL